ncbi:MAG: accessory gene regulator B family protein [Clostridium sp.]|nr:accessory gene regulator B family protein [Clostridium sp.]
MYIYGFFQAVMMLLNIITTLLLGLVFQLLLPCILLNISYIPIRIYAGGHHADTPFRCYVSSTIMIAVLLAVIKWVIFSGIISAVMFITASAVILILAPIETENNPLDETERKVYRKRTKYILTIEIVIFAVFIILSKNLAAETMALGITTESLMLIVGLIKNKHCQKN